MSESEYTEQRLTWKWDSGTWSGSFADSMYAFDISPTHSGKFLLKGFLHGAPIYSYVYDTLDEAKGRALPLAVEWLELELEAMKTYLEEQGSKPGKITGLSSPWG